MADDAERALKLGIQTQYWDALGTHRTADPEALARMIEALSPSAQTPHARLLPPTCIIRQGRDDHQVRLDVEPDREVAWTVSTDTFDASGAGTGAHIALPDDLARGTYRLRAATRSPEGNRSNDATLLVAPERAWQGADTSPRRIWALAVQLYSVRSRRNWGHGDFTDLAPPQRLIAKIGIRSQRT